MSSTELLQAIVDGILTGGVYALMAAGLTLIFGVMDIINIAQGVMVVLGAYLSYELSVHLGIGLLPGLLITVPAMFVLGVAMEFFFMRRLRDDDRTGMSILVTFAIAILIEGILSAIFGVDYVQLHASYVDKSVHVLGFYLPYIYLIGFALAVVLLVALYYMLYRTKFGRAVRASLQNRTAADLIGVNVNRTRTISVGIGVAVTAIGGHGVRRHHRLQPQQRLRPDLATAGDRDPRRDGQHRRRDGGRGPPAGDQRRRSGRVVADLGAAGVLRRAGRGAVRETAGVVRPIGSARPVSETVAPELESDAGTARRRGVCYALWRRSAVLLVAVVFAVFPVAITDPTATSIAVFTLIFMVATAAWNVFSGYSGYLALGHAVFFGSGGYAVALAARDWHFKGGWDVFALLPFADWSPP